MNFQLSMNLLFAYLQTTEISEGPAHFKISRIIVGLTKLVLVTSNELMKN